LVRPSRNQSPRCLCAPHEHGSGHDAERVEPVRAIDHEVAGGCDSKHEWDQGHRGEHETEEDLDCRLRKVSNCHFRHYPFKRSRSMISALHSAAADVLCSTPLGTTNNSPD